MSEQDPHETPTDVSTWVGDVSPNPPPDKERQNQFSPLTTPSFGPKWSALNIQAKADGLIRLHILVCDNNNYELMNLQGGRVTWEKLEPEEGEVGMT